MTRVLWKFWNRDAGGRLQRYTFCSSTQLATREAGQPQQRSLYKYENGLPSPRSWFASALVWTEVLEILGQRVGQLIVGVAQWLSRVNERLFTLFVMAVASLALLPSRPRVLWDRRSSMEWYDDLTIIERWLDRKNSGRWYDDADDIT
jgi:hypothetical protein